MTIKNLWVVMPVFNEEEALEGVVLEWLDELNKSDLNYTLCILNDGSTDGTQQLTEKLSMISSRIQVINKDNSGHGQTCIYGYQHALANHADWVLQIDSDGQCDPKYLKQFLKNADQHQCIYGYRQSRDDGLKRKIITKFVVLFTYIATRSFVRDPNVPYRMMKSDILLKAIENVPRDFHLANIFVAVCCSKLAKIVWLPIHFRNRSGGTPSVSTFSFIRHGFKLFVQLKLGMKKG